MIPTNRFTILFLFALLLTAVQRSAGAQAGSTYTPPVPATRCSDHISVLSFGADNTGNTDSRAAIQAAIDSGQSLWFPTGTYRIDGTLEFRHSNVEYCFDQSVFVTNAPPLTFFRVSARNIVLREFTIDGEMMPVARFAIKIVSGASDVFLIRSVVRNIRGDATQNQQYGCFVDLENVENFVIQSCLFDDISALDDGLPAIAGFCGGIYLGTEQGDILTGSSGEVTGCCFQNIATERDAFVSGFASDADAIRFFYSGQVTPQSSNLAISLKDNTFNNCQKRAVKISHVGGIDVIGHHAFNDRTDYEGHAAVELLGDATNIHVAQLHVCGNYTRGLWLSSATNVLAEDIYVERRVTTSSPEPVNYAFLVGDLQDQESYEGIVLRGLMAVNLKAVSMKRGSNVSLEGIDVGEARNETVDDLVRLQDCDQVTLDGVFNDESGSKIGRVMLVQDCRNVTLRNMRLSGWGYPVVQIRETTGGRCEDISMEDFVVRQAGYATSTFPVPTEVYTLLVRSDTIGGGLFDGVDRVRIANGHVLLATQPAQFPTNVDYEFGVSIEGRDGRLDNVSVRYEGGSITEMRALLALSRAERGVVEDVRLVSNASVRALHTVEASGLSVQRLTVDVPSSAIYNDVTSTRLMFDELFVRTGFNPNIAGLLNDPLIMEF